MKKRIMIEGMTCIHCTQNVRIALNDLPGVKNTKVRLKNKEAIASVDHDIPNEVIQKAIKDIGYEVVGIEAVKTFLIRR